MADGRLSQHLAELSKKRFFTFDGCVRRHQHEEHDEQKTEDPVHDIILS